MRALDVGRARSVSPPVSSVSPAAVPLSIALEPLLGLACLFLLPGQLGLSPLLSLAPLLLPLLPRSHRSASLATQLLDMLGDLGRWIEQTQSTVPLAKLEDKGPCSLAPS